MASVQLAQTRPGIVLVYLSDGIVVKGADLPIQDQNRPKGQGETDMVLIHKGLGFFLTPEEFPAAQDHVAVFINIAGIRQRQAVAHNLAPDDHGAVRPVAVVIPAAGHHRVHRLGHFRGQHQLSGGKLVSGKIAPELAGIHHLYFRKGDGHVVYLLLPG